MVQQRDYIGSDIHRSAEDSSHKRHGPYGSLGILNALDLATCHKSSDSRLDNVLGCLTAFTLTAPGGQVRLSLTSSESGQGAITPPPPLLESARRDCTPTEA